MTFVAHQRLKASDLTALEEGTAAALIADGALPGMLIGAPSIVEADSAGFTAETVVQSITVPVVAGRQYSIHWEVGFTSSASATDTARGNIRVGSITGDIIASGNIVCGVVGGVGARLHLTAFYTADATGDQTFVFTGQRAGGSGNISLEAGVGRPSVAYVRYERTP